MSKPPAARGFDEKKMLALSQPLTLTITKKYAGNRSTPVPLPPARMDPMNLPGKGYTYDEVRGLSPLLLRTAGGGSYTVAVSDDTGGTYEYDMWFDPTSFPDTLPAEHAAAAPHRQAPAQVIPIAQAQAVQGVQGMQPMMVAGGGSGGIADWVHLVPAGVPRQNQGPVSVAPGGGIYVDPAMLGQNPSTPRYGYNGYAPVSSISPNFDDGRRSLEEQNQRLRETLLKLEGKQDRERDIAALKDELKEVGRKLAEKPEPPKNDEMLAILREEIRELKSSKKDEGTTQLIITMMQAQQQASEARAREQRESDARNTQNFQTMMTSMMTMMQRPAGPDPTLMLIIESFRQSSDAQRDTLRGITENAREDKRTALGPKDFIEMSQKMNEANGAGTLLKQVSEAYTSVFGMARTQIELLKENLGGGGPGPVQELLGSAIERAGKIAEGYIQMKRDVEVGQARAFEAQARAQMGPQAQAQGPQPGAPPQLRAVPPAPVQQAQGQGLGQPMQPQPVQVPGHPAPPPSGPPKTAVEVQIEEQEMRLFGPALEGIRRLRLGVKDGKLQPHEVVQAVFQAMTIVQQRGWTVPALDFYASDQIQTFVDILLPNTEPAFITAVAELLYRAKQTGIVPTSSPPLAPAPAPAPVRAVAPGPPPPPPPDEDGDEDGDEEDDDEDEEDGDDAS